MISQISLREQLPNIAERRYLKDLYRASFPEEERRCEHEVFDTPPMGLQLKLIYLEGVESETARIGEALVGFLTLWCFEDFAFVEHFVIDPRYRGRGYGSIIMKQLLESISSLPIVLECELAESSPNASRRIRFYEDLGFKILPYSYAQPPYQDHLDFVPMHLLSTEDYGADEYTSLKRKIYERIYCLTNP